MKTIKDILMLATILCLMAGSFWLGREYDSFSSLLLEEPVADTSPVLSPAQLYRVSAYCPGPCCCGIWADGTTASGKYAEGLIVAAPQSIPFGTVLLIPGYGRATVEDRGAAIKGNRLDVLFTDKDGVSGHQRALEWGVQWLRVKTRMESAK